LYNFAFDYENVFLLMAPAYQEIQASLIRSLYPHYYPARPKKYYQPIIMSPYLYSGH